jgi:hypothetical protein
MASGRLMFTGAPGDLVPWFAKLGYGFAPETQGVISDWALDLVSLGFAKGAAAELPGHGMKSVAAGDPACTKAASGDEGAAVVGRLMESIEELEAAAAAFMQHYLSTQQRQVTVRGSELAAAHKVQTHSAYTNYTSSQPMTAVMSPAAQAVHAQPMLYLAEWWRKFGALLWREMLITTR